MYTPHNIKHRQAVIKSHAKKSFIEKDLTILKTVLLTISITLLLATAFMANGGF